MLRKYLKVLAWSTAFTVMAAVPAHAEPVTVALFGAAFASTFAGALVTTVITTAASIGISLLAKAIFKPETPKRQPVPPLGMQLELSLGSNDPIAFPVGWSATAGILNYPGVWGSSGGTPNAYLVKEIVLADLPCPDDPVIWVDDEKCTIDWNATPTTQGYPVTEYRVNGVDHLWVQFDDGSQTTANSYMTGKFGSHATRPYTVAMIGRGQTRARVTALWNRELFKREPQFLFETTGIPLYNVSKDSSVGGSGLHRWDDPSTWEPSSNPIVQAYNVRRGIFYYPTPNSRTGAEWIFGGNNKKELNAYRLPVSNWIAAINACDATVTNADASTEAACRAGGLIRGDMEPADVIDDLLKSANARMAEIGGIYKVHVGAPSASVYSFTDGDIVITEGQSLEPFPSLDGVHNAIESSAPEPSERWVMKPAPGRFNPDWEAEDGGRQLVASVDFPMVPYRYQVQRLMLALIKDARRFRNHVITLPPDAWKLEPNDTVDWTSERFGYTAKKFIVTSITGRRNFNQVVALKEVDPDDFDWTAADDELPVSVGDLVTERPAPQLMSGWQAVPANFVDASSNDRRPSIQVSYDGGLSDIRAVRVQVRLDSTTAIVFDGEHPYDVATASPAVILNGTFLPNTAYEARGIFVPYSGREMEWSAWLDVTTANVLLGSADVDIQDALGDVGDQLAWLGQGTREAIRNLQTLGSLLSEQDLANFTDKDILRRELNSRTDEIEAGYLEAIEVATGPESAIAQSIETLFVSMGGETASVNVRWMAEAGPTGYSVRYGVELGVDGADYRSASMFGLVPDNPADPTRWGFDADQIVFTSDGGTTFNALFAAGTTFIDNARITNLTSDNILAGSIIAESLDADAVSADTILAQNAAITGVLTVGNYITIDGPNGRILVDDA